MATAKLQEPGWGHIQRGDNFRQSRRGWGGGGGGSLDNLSPAFMEEIFHRTNWLPHRPNNIQVNVCKTVKYGDKSLRTFGPHIWNSLPDHIYGSKS